MVVQKEELVVALLFRCQSACGMAVPEEEPYW